MKVAVTSRDSNKDIEFEKEVFPSWFVINEVNLSPKLRKISWLGSGSFVSLLIKSNVICGTRPDCAWRPQAVDLAHVMSPVMVGSLGRGERSIRGHWTLKMREGRINRSQIAVLTCRIDARPKSRESSNVYLTPFGNWVHHVGRYRCMLFVFVSLRRSVQAKSGSDYPRFSNLTSNSEI